MKRLKRIYIEITNVCNLACSFCPRTKRTPAFMDAGQFDMILAQIKPFCDYIYLHVKGEPLLHPLLGEFLDICAAWEMQANITTNGTLIGRTGELLISKPAVRQINFSLHDMEAADKRVLDGLNLTKETYLENVLNFVEAARTRSNMLLSLRLWNLSHSGETQGDADGKNSEIISKLESAFGRTDKIGERDLSERGIKLAQKVYLNRDYEFQWPDIGQKEEQACGFCYGLKDQAAILVDGTVVPCCLDGEGVIGLGNVFQTDFSEIITNERAERIVHGFQNRCAVEELCRKCGYKERFSL